MTNEYVRSLDKCYAGAIPYLETGKGKPAKTRLGRKVLSRARKSRHNPPHLFETQLFEILVVSKVPMLYVMVGKSRHTYLLERNQRLLVDLEQFAQEFSLCS
jgi:hypothetical protein